MSSSDLQAVKPLVPDLFACRTMNYVACCVKLNKMTNIIHDFCVFGLLSNTTCAHIHWSPRHLFVCLFVSSMTSPL